MIGFYDARRLVLEQSAVTTVETVPLLEAGGRVLAEPLIAPRDLPTWDTSAMDGFAVDSASSVNCPRLTVTGYLPAGVSADTVRVLPGTAVRIMTGAPIPVGCDAVVPLEETVAQGDTVQLQEPVVVGQHIRRQGGDIRAGAVAVPAGIPLRPQQINLLASYSCLTVPVHGRGRVAILSTGDELIEPGEPLTAGAVVNSNQFSLACAVQEAGGEPVLLGIARDDRESLLEKLRIGLEADMLITSAGVSAGDRDLVRDCLAELGVRQLFWKIAMKPGGPTAFGMYGRVPVFSLPGNPVSTMVTFEMLVRPALLTMMGHRKVIRPVQTAVLRDSLAKQPGKTHFVRVGLVFEQGVLYADVTGTQHTYNLHTMLWADGLALIPAEQASVNAGETVQVCLLGELLQANG